jgi:hypothetical protein
MACISRLPIEECQRDTADSCSESLPGFNSDIPEVYGRPPSVRIEPGPQVTFHHATGDGVGILFRETVTEVDDDHYVDWSGIAFRVIRVEGLHVFIVNHGICPELFETGCLSAKEGVRMAEVEFANFSQRFEKGMTVFFRCHEWMEADEMGYMGEPPPPYRGVVLAVRCPSPTKWARRIKKHARKQYFFDEVGIW